MSGLSSLSNALTRAVGDGSNGIFNLNIPSISLGGFLPITEPTTVTSLGEVANSLTNTIGNLNQISHMAYCLGEVLTDPKSMLRVLDNITNNIVAVALEMAERLASVIEGQILGMFGTVVGTAINFVNSILDFLTSIVKMYDALKTVWENLKARSLGNWNDFMSQKECEYMFANIAACMLNKLYGDKLEKFEREVTSKITEKGQDIQTSLRNSLADTNNLSNYIRHESFLMDKATKQLSLFA